MNTGTVIRYPSTFLHIIIVLYVENSARRGVQNINSRVIDFQSGLWGGSSNWGQVM